MNRKYLQGVSVLMLGNGGAQIITLACSPILARLYEPRDFAAVTVIQTLINVFLPFICGKYEVAVVTARSDGEAANLVGLSIWIAGIASLCMLTLLVLAGDWTRTALGADALGWWLWAVPTAVFLSALAMVARYSANRRSEYGIISRYNIVQTASNATLGLVMGWAHYGSDGLILAYMLSIGIGTCLVTWVLRSEIRTGCCSDAKAMRAAGWKYRDFPLFNASSSVLNALTLAMPVFFIARMTQDESLGSYGFMMRIALAPLSLIGGAVSQVHLKHLSDLVRAGLPASAYLQKLAVVLAAIAAAPTVILMVGAPSLFELVFGAPWRYAGELMSIVAPAVAIQFVVSTVSTACDATGHNRLAAIWKVLSFVTTLAMFCIVPHSDGARTILTWLTALNIGLYLIFYAMIAHAVRRPKVSHH